jgi:ubiquinone/menaquinone biosynthesis C-methylase UbiE
MTHNAREFDKIAQEIFYPIYPVIAGDILKETGIRAGRLLDIGSGGGHLGLSVLKAAPGLTGVLLDIDPEAVLIADRRAAEWGLGNRVVAVRGRAEEIPLADGSVDLIVSRGSIHFWDDVDKAFSEILRVLTSGGMTYIGSGMGSRKLNEEIAEKMKTANPDWPDCVHRIAKGHTIDDYRAILTDQGVEFKTLSGEDKGKWTIVCKK